MPNRILSALTWPGRKLIGLELSGKVIWSLILVDAGGLAMWLFTLNGYFYHRPLDADDWSTIVCVSLLCYAACLQYGLRPGRPWWHWVAKALAGQALAAAILHFVFTELPLDMSGRQVLKFSLSYLPWLLLTRVLYLVCRRLLPRAPLECVRLALVGAGGFFFFGGRFITSAGVGSGDSYWYCIMLGDFVKQWRAGIFPVFVGQSEYAFNGAISPLRLAPGLQHLTGIVDLLTGQWLPFYTLQNLSLTLSALAGGFSAYFCVAAILPRQRWTALAIATLYLACPGVLALGYKGDLFMSMTALPFIPLACFGLWRTLQAGDRAPIAWTVLPLAAAWYCHPPIALWLTLIAVLAHFAIALQHWRDPGLYAWWGRGVVLFVLAASYVFVSVVTLHLPTAHCDIGVILDGIRDSFPSVFLPISETGYVLSYYQLGWTLWCLFFLATVGVLISPRRSEGVLLLSAGGMLLLLLPIPHLNATLWQSLPATIRDITFLWPMQRFYPIVAGLVIVAAAGVWAKLGPVRWMGKMAGLAFIAAGLLWSFREGSSFVFNAYFIRGPAPVPVPDPMLDRNNIILTRYAFNSFPFAPPYASHGYVDPYLENRVLAPDLKKELSSNVVAAEPADAASAIALASTYDGDRTTVLAPALTLAPGVRYAVRFTPTAVPPAGSLLLLGKFVTRQYYLPDSAMGMAHHLPGNAFGFTPTSRDFFPLWTVQTQPEIVGIRYVYEARPAAAIPATFAHVYLQPYSVNSLPIRISSWMPYRAKTSSASAGAWLETPRMYIPGYAATVNGRRARISSSPSGLVAVSLQAGQNDVVLRYPGPWLLRASYWTALATWAAVIAAIVLGARRRWLRAVAASDGA